MLLEASAADIDRFMGYVDKLPNGCWFYTGARSRGGGNCKWYGSFRIGGKVVRAHRFASEVLGRQECPTGCHRDHTCEFSLCVNPEHIEIVTHEENEKRKQTRRSAPGGSGHTLKKERKHATGSRKNAVRQLGKRQRATVGSRRRNVRE